MSLKPLRDEVAAAASIGAARPKIPTAAALNWLHGLEASEVGRLLGQHKVCLLAAQRLGRVRSRRARAIVEAVGERLEILEARKAPLVDRLVAIDRMAQAMATPVAEIKGCAIRHVYDDPAARDLGDIDLFVGSIDAAWALAERLLDSGYRIDVHELPWLKRAPDGALYGQIRLRAPDGPADLDVDIHFERFSVRHCGWLDVPISGCSGLSGLGDTANLALLIADAAGEYYVPTKLLNDLWHALRGGWVSVPELLARLDQAALAEYGCAVIERMCEIQSLGPGVASELLCLPRRRERLPRGQDTVARQRWLGTTAHAMRIGSRTSWWAALRYGASAFWYYRAPLRVRVLRGDVPAVGLERAAPDRCIRLVPVDVASGLTPQRRRRPTVVRDVRWERVDGASIVRRGPTNVGDLVRVGGRVFLPTISYGLPAELVWRARRAQAELVGEPAHGAAPAVALRPRSAAVVRDSTRDQRQHHR